MADGDGYELSERAVQRTAKVVKDAIGRPLNAQNLGGPVRYGSGTIRQAVNATGTDLNLYDVVALSSGSLAFAEGGDLQGTAVRATQATTAYTKSYGIVVGYPAENEEYTLVSLGGGLVNYTGTVPEEGKSVGPVSGSFAVSTTGAPYFTVVGVSTQFSLCDVVPYQPATISPVTLGAQLADGASVTVTLSDGRQVSADNKSGQTLEAGNALCVADPYTGLHYITGSALPSTSGGGSTVSSTGQTWFYGTVALASDANMTDGFNVDNVVTLDGTTWPATTFQINNPLQLTGAEDDEVLFVESSTARSFSPQGYFAVNIRRRQPREFRGVIVSTGLDSTSVSATVETIVALDAAPVPSTGGLLTVQNPFGLVGESGDYCRFIEDISTTSVTYILEKVAFDAGPYIGKTDSSISSAASGTVSVWTGTPGSESDSGDNITAYNRTSTTIGSGKWVKLSRVNGHWYMEPWEC